jgi:cardiolipin synthase
MCSGARELRPSDWRRLSLLQRGLNWISYQLVRLAIGVAGYRGKH